MNNGLNPQVQGQGQTFVLEDISRPRNKAKDNNTAGRSGARGEGQTDIPRSIPYARLRHE